MMETPLQDNNADWAFRFEPSEVNLTGSAFSLPFKLVTWAMCLALLVWMIRLQLPLGQSGTTWAWTAWVMIVYTAWVIQRSRLTARAEHLQQDWIWSKKMAYADMVFVQVIRIPWLEWLLAPRVYARSFQGKSIFFYCADPVVLKEMSRLTQAHKDWMNQSLSAKSS